MTIDPLPSNDPTGADDPRHRQAGPSTSPRLAALRRLALLDTPTEQAFDRLTRLAAKILHAPVALLSLVDGDRSFFKSSAGLPEHWAARREMPLSHSVCQHVVATNTPLVINDARAHPLVSDNRAVADLRIVAYLGIPLTTSDGHTLGTFAVIDTVPREWAPDDVTALGDLAASALTEIELRAETCQRQQAEQRLRLMESVVTAVLIAEADSSEPSEPRIVFVNDAYTRLTGYSPDDVIGRTHQVLSGSETDRSQIETVRRALASWKPARLELLTRRKDGSAFWAELNVVPIADRAGRYSHWVVVHRDISVQKAAEETLRENDARKQAVLQSTLESVTTEKKSLEAQLRHAQRMEGIGMVAGGVAHDFNNLLTVISGFTEMVISRMKPEDSSRVMLREVYKAGERGAGLTRQLLAFSRKQILQVRVLDLNDLIADAGAMLSRVIGEDVQMATDLEPALGRVTADAGQIEQVLLNLCVNARDAMPRGGRITIQTRNAELDDNSACVHPGVKPGRYVLLAFRDTGTGMDEATRARVFEPFFTTKESGKGTGLGLATVYGIVKQSNGVIEFDSAPGQGTTFRIYLPRVEEAVPARKSASGEFKAPRGTETLLVVDDDAAVRTLSRLALQSFGYRVLDAVDGPTALSVAGAHQAPIHLLVTDVVMPGMTGRELADHLTGLRPALKVLYVSGYTDDAVIRAGVTAGDVAFLAKPITPGVLARKVRQVLDASG
jgi:two-component system, cell cycle sensor histidine kinase and response regulator CckA